MIKHVICFFLCFPVYADHIRTTDLQDICTTKTSTIRDVSKATKNRIKVRDGFWSIYGGIGSFEIDHRVSLWLGGSNSDSNLMLQPYFGQCNAHHKDKLEIRLHHMACSGLITINKAQDDIYYDWIGAYERYIDPKGCK